MVDAVGWIVVGIVGFVKNYEGIIIVSALQHCKEDWLQKNRNCVHLTNNGLCRLNGKRCRRKNCAVKDV